MQTHQLIVRCPEADNAGHKPEESGTQHVRLRATTTLLVHCDKLKGAVLNGTRSKRSRKVLFTTTYWTCTSLYSVR